MQPFPLNCHPASTPYNQILAFSIRMELNETRILGLLIQLKASKYTFLTIMHANHCVALIRKQLRKPVNTHGLTKQIKIN